MSFQICINPGSGPVNHSTIENAKVNMKQFVIDCNVKGLRFRRKKSADYGEGRFAFTVSANGYSHEIQMPGLPLEEVRFMHTPEKKYGTSRAFTLTVAVGCGCSPFLAKSTSQQSTWKTSNTNE